MDQHGEPAAALDQCADRTALQPNQEITLPMSGNSAIIDLKWAVADQRLRSDMSPRLGPRPCPRHPQGPASAQATDQIPLQRTA